FSTYLTLFYGLSQGKKSRNPLWEFCCYLLKVLSRMGLDLLNDGSVHAYCCVLKGLVSVGLSEHICLKKQGLSVKNILYKKGQKMKRILLSAIASVALSCGASLEACATVDHHDEHASKHHGHHGHHEKKHPAKIGDEMAKECEERM